MKERRTPLGEKGLRRPVGKERAEVERRERGREKGRKGQGMMREREGEKESRGALTGVIAGKEGFGLRRDGVVRGMRRAGGEEQRAEPVAWREEGRAGPVPGDRSLVWLAERERGRLCRKRFILLKPRGSSASDMVSSDSAEA